MIRIMKIKWKNIRGNPTIQASAKAIHPNGGIS